MTHYGLRAVVLIQRRVKAPHDVKLKTRSMKAPLNLCVSRRYPLLQSVTQWTLQSPQQLLPGDREGHQEGVEKVL